MSKEPTFKIKGEWSNEDIEALKEWYGDRFSLFIGAYETPEGFFNHSLRIVRNWVDEIKTIEDVKRVTPFLGTAYMLIADRKWSERLPKEMMDEFVQMAAKVTVITTKRE